MAAAPPWGMAAAGAAAAAPLVGWGGAAPLDMVAAEAEALLVEVDELWRRLRRLKKAMVAGEVLAGNCTK